MNLVLIRSYEPTYSHGLLIVGSLRLMTIERPWLVNPRGAGGVPRESCIPEGSYALHPYDSQAKPDCYEMVNPATGVYAQPSDIPYGQDWGRSNCLIHAGNYVEDVIGCIAVGISAGKIGDRAAVKESVEAMNQLRAKLGREEVHTLQIVPGSDLGSFK